MRLFDHTRGWGGRPPLGVPTFVVSHRPPPEDWPARTEAPYTFVGDLESAVAKATAVAGEGIVSVSGANLAQQCLRAGLLDEVWMDLVPVLLGEGIRYLDDVNEVRLSDPTIINGAKVTHLRYRVER